MSMKIEILEDAKVIMSNHRGKHDYFGWPSAAVLRDGRIAVAASGFRIGHVCPFGKACVVYSSDNGKTFSAPEVVIDTPLDDRDSGIVPFGESGVIVTSFNNTREFQRNSNPDNAYIQSYLETVTDEEEKDALGSEFRVSGDNGVTWSEVFRSPVTSPHGPCELADGTLLWTGCVFNDGYSAPGCRPGLACYEMNGDGSMKLRSVIKGTENGYFCEPHAIQLKSGRIVCHIRKDDDFSLWQSVSDDNGHTWTEPRQLLTARGGAPAHLIEKDGVLVSAYGYREYPYGIRVMTSADNGESWEKDIVLYENTVTGDLGYPATAELPDGSFLTVFYAHPEENSPAVIMSVKWKFA